jgi:hypothetical protein
MLAPRGQSKTPRTPLRRRLSQSTPLDHQSRYTPRTTALPRPPRITPFRSLGAQKNAGLPSRSCDQPRSPAFNKRRARTRHDSVVNARRKQPYANPIIHPPAGVSMRTRRAHRKCRSRLRWWSAKISCSRSCASQGTNSPQPLPPAQNTNFMLRWIESPAVKRMTSRPPSVTFICVLP